jgi:tetratricopeptide (TPR) repeat protein
VVSHRETWFYRDDVTLIRRAAELQPESWAARFRLGTTLQLENRHEEAIVELREALRLFPEHAPIRAAIAVNLAAIGLVDEAAAELDAALAARLDDEDRVRILLQLANLRVAQRRFEEAAAQFGAAVALAPDSAEAHYGRGLVLRQLGDTPGALAAMRRSVEADGAVAKSQLALGTLLLESGDVEGAIAALRGALALEPEHVGAAATLERALQRAAD